MSLIKNFRHGAHSRRMEEFLWRAKVAAFIVVFVAALVGTVWLALDMGNGFAPVPYGAHEHTGQTPGLKR